jgi:hypothetical protein
VINAGVGSYYLSVAPNASGCATLCRWKTTRTLTAGTSSLVNGYSNTWGPLNNADHPAGNWCATRIIGGYADWYLPAKDELNTMYVNKGSMPAGEGYATPSSFLTSNEHSTPSVCRQSFDSGTILSSFKTSTRDCTRAVRRSPI